MKKTPLLSPALILLCAAGPLVACSGDKANIGNTSAIGSQLSDYAATWDGYAEAYTFSPDGSDHVRLTITADGQGTLLVGDLPAYAPPTDPNVGYPPGIDYSKNGYFQAPPLWEGFVYPVYGARVETDRIQVGVKTNDIFTTWCGLQTSYDIITGYMSTPDGGGSTATPPPGPGWVPIYGYSCLPGPGGASSSNGGPWECDAQITSTDGGTSYQAVDCNKYWLCTEQMCTCSAGGCVSSPVIDPGAAPSAYPVELDGALDNNGETLTGTLLLSASLRVTVVLQKQ
jgi:hypothetical protein